MLIRALSQSMDVHTMVHVARRVIRSYSIHERTGIPETLSVPNNDAARQIVEDMANEGELLSFIELLLDIQRNGFVGRKIRIPRIQDIVQELVEDGYRFDRATGSFVEDAELRKTQNWGVLQAGKHYHVGLLAMDVRGNSELVRHYGHDVMDGIYGDLRRMVTRISDRRNGRIWMWEGDGGIIAFYSGDVATTAVKSGMELLHEIHLYNAMRNPLDHPLHLRFAVHTGQIEYQQDAQALESSPAIKKVQEIEAEHTDANTLTASSTVFNTLDPVLQSCFQSNGSSDGNGYRQYRLVFQEHPVPA